MTITPGPNVALLLLALGALGIYAEFCAPGRILPGAAGSVLAVFGFASLSRFPISFPGTLAIVSAFAFFALEAKLVSRGLLTACGGVALIEGLKNLIAAGNPELRIQWATALCIGIPLSLATSFLLSVAVRARHNKAAK